MNRITSNLLPVIAIVAATLFLLFALPSARFTLIEPSVRDIDPAVFHDAYAERPERFFFIDVRPHTAYSRRHATGSVNVPLEFLHEEWRHLPKRGVTIVLVGSGPADAELAYSYLEHHGFLDVRRIDAGIDAWVKQRLPTEGLPRE